MNRCIVGAAALLLLAAGAGCVERGGASGEDAAQHGTSHIAPGDSATLALAAAAAGLQPGALNTVRAEPVRGLTGPGGKPFEVALRTPEVPSSHVRRFGMRTFGIGLRVGTPDVSQYPCSSCHLGRELVLGVERVADAHQNIRPEHPAGAGLTCGTCHAPENIALLALANGERATMDHAYRLCSECHFAQAETWAGGAHGKRLDGWQGRRVVMGCADCHDPHAPRLKKRIPFRAPRLIRDGGIDP